MPKPNIFIQSLTRTDFTTWHIYYQCCPNYVQQIMFYFYFSDAQTCKQKIRNGRNAYSMFFGNLS